MESLLASTVAVALAEVGDKTQLLALVLAARFRKPWPIAAGILVATAANHTVAAWLGLVVADLLTPEVLRWVLIASFAAMAGWTLIPDKLDDKPRMEDAGVFIATTVSFFLVEIGDKTQIATTALAARYHEVALVAIGTTIGLLIANLPLVWIGDRLADRLPVKTMRYGAALLFLAFAVLTYFFA